MIRCARRFSAAAVVAGFGLTAVIARAADFQNNSPLKWGSGVVLVSASDEAPTGASESPPARLDDPRGGVRSADSTSGRTATYPPKKAVAKKPTAKPAQKPGMPATNSSDGQAAAPKTQQPTSGQRRAVQQGQSETRPMAVVHRDSHLTAHFTVEEKPEAIRPPETASPQSAAPPPPPADASHGDASHGEYCPDCDSCGCDCCCAWCAGLEYMFLRPHFGNDSAFHELTQTTTPGTGNNPGLVTNADRTVNFDYGYDSDFRVFFGRHLGNGELRFGYMHIQGDAEAEGTATRGAAANDGIALVGAIGGSQLNGDGDSIASETHLHLNVFDIDRVQNLELPGCFQCGSGWDINWSYGVRIADVNRTMDERDFIVGTGVTNLFELDSTFVGAGPKIGIEARRNIRGSHFFGFFGADASLLVGHYHSRVRSFFPTSTPGAQDTLDTQENSLTRAVPNIEMELGVTWQPNCHTMLTTGWMVESLTDAVASTANTGGCNNCMPSPITGSGNILSFDGLFIRLEHCF
jgi:hypothetical protein